MYIKLATIENKLGQKLLAVHLLLDQGCLLLVHSGPQNAKCIYNCLLNRQSCHLYGMLLSNATAFLLIFWEVGSDETMQDHLSYF